MNEQEAIQLDDVYLQKCKTEFQELLQSILEREIDKDEIKLYLFRNGHFFLRYGKWDEKDQFSIKYDCYPDTSINLTIETNRKNYKKIKMLK